MTKKIITMPRDAQTGRLVTKQYAQRHPGTTTVEKRVVQTSTRAPKKR